MKNSHLIFVSLFLFVACSKPEVAVNPDPNHTHADFAVWMDGTQLDFSSDEFMSGSSDASDPDHTKHDMYLHLHDKNGHLIHRHKPGLTLKQFFTTLQVGFSEKCYSSGVPGADGEECSEYPFRLFVNGDEKPFDDLSYIFTDVDTVLITNALANSEVQKQLLQMTDDSCLYSQTCPERGKPPTENCIADPTIPCVIP